jgi:hypothetical protein
MFQRKEKRPDPTPNRPTPIEQTEPTPIRETPANQARPSSIESHPNESGGLSTADLAQTGRPKPESSEPIRMDPSIDQAAHPGPMGSRPDPQHTDGAYSALFRPEDAEQFRSHWTDVQTGFVDEPRHAVEQADELVANVIKRLATVFADERTKLEHQWDRGEDVSTEDLRVALQRYRSFFDRLLNV